MNVPSAVRELALHPFRELPPAPGSERIERDGVLLILDPFPSAQIVEPMDVLPDAVTTSLASVRALARERGKSVLAWWLGPDRRDLEEPLEAAGLAHRETPGFEAVENAMVLLGPPEGQVSGVVVRETSTYEEFAAAHGVVMEAFDFPDAMRAEAAAALPKRWEEYTTPANPGRQFTASIDGRIVGSAFAVFGQAGVNLFGGAVLEEARGQGVYKELIAARWEAAVGRGTPALTVQAGRMSRPILERLGFRDVGQAHLYVDTISG